MHYMTYEIFEFTENASSRPTLHQESSRGISTTNRNTEVSFIGNNTRSFELEGLGKKESWTLISKISFGG